MVLADQLVKNSRLRDRYRGQSVTTSVVVPYQHDAKTGIMGTNMGRISLLPIKGDLGLRRQPQQIPPYIANQVKQARARYIPASKPAYHHQLF